MHFLIDHVILTAFNVGNAIFDASRIKAGKRIYHGINFALYLALVLALLIVGKSTVAEWIITPISAFANRQLFFDITLNLLRGLKWYYVSTERPPKAIMDRIEVSFFGYNGKATTFCYTLLYINTILFYYLIH